MSISKWFKDREARREAQKKEPTVSRIRKGTWEKCPKCHKLFLGEELTKNLRVCSHCKYHLPLTAEQRIGLLVDEGTFVETNPEIEAEDILKFVAAKPYEESLRAAKEKTGLKEALVTGRAKMGNHQIAFGVMDRRFVGASMNRAVGQKLVKLFKLAAEERRGVVLVVASGGARMQEGGRSLFQMAVTAASATRFAETGLPYVAILTDPTTGGVSASFAALADITFAEPGAIVGFTGPRVIEQTIRHKMPKGAQSSEFQLEHGMIDEVVPREKLREKIITALDYLMRDGITNSFGKPGIRPERKPLTFSLPFEKPLFEMEESLRELREMDLTEKPELKEEIKTLEREVREFERSLYRDMNPWQKVQLARHPNRPRAKDYLEELFEHVLILSGDRCFADDQAILTALATIKGIKVMVIAHNKGRNSKENAVQNSGSPRPEGFRKAERAMRLAEAFNLPIITLVDTLGAYPDLKSEERGQSWAIAECLSTLSSVKVPVVVVGIGEGGSGGALAIGFGDHTAMLEHSYYSVITPEGCASILYKDPELARSKVEEMAESLHLTAKDMLKLGIIDEIIEEPEGAAHRDPQTTCKRVGEVIARTLPGLMRLPVEELLERRFQRLLDI